MGGRGRGERDRPVRYSHENDILRNFKYIFGKQEVSRSVPARLMLFTCCEIILRVNILQHMYVINDLNIGYSFNRFGSAGCSISRIRRPRVFWIHYRRTRRESKDRCPNRSVAYTYVRVHHGYIV